MGARITVNLTATGELENWLNRLGHDVLVRELQRLDEKHEHFHLGPKGIGELEVSARPYRTDDRVLGYGKVLFRTDEWDKQYFPHVLGDTV